LANGIYLLNITATNGTISTHKIVKHWLVLLIIHTKAHTMRGHFFCEQNNHVFICYKIDVYQSSKQSYQKSFIAIQNN
jgi:hypothetical protein